MIKFIYHFSFIVIKSTKKPKQRENMELSVVLLAYKEEENLRIMIPRIREQLRDLTEDYEIIVVDTKEPLDNSRQVCEENGAIYVNQADPGFGGAYKKGIETAKGDSLLYLDSDGSHDPCHIPDIYHKFNEINAETDIIYYLTHSFLPRPISLKCLKS